MTWIQWILALSTLLLTIRIVKFSIRNQHLLTLGFSATVVLISAAEIVQQIIAYSPIVTIDYALDVVVDWINISWIAFLLATLTLLIRHVKPHFARFPRIFAIFPLLIIPVHYLGINTLVLKNWVFGIYLGGALSISLLLVAVWLIRDSSHWKTFVSLLCFLGAFVFEWLPNINLEESLTFTIINILILIGIILLYEGFIPTFNLILESRLDERTGIPKNDIQH